MKRDTKRVKTLMNAQLGIHDARAGSTKVSSSCSMCPGLDLNICFLVSAGEHTPERSVPTRISQSEHTVPARRIIWRGQDLQDVVPVICSGWAAAIVMLSNGSRQIVSFLLPGDIISTTLLFESKPYCLVEAITDVRYRAFDRIELKSLLFRQPELLDRFSKAWVAEKARADQLIVDLGRRTADERIARMILNLIERLSQRGMLRGDAIEFDFPLRQHHIADATGLTPVHVSKVLTEFRRRGLISINERSMTVLDLAEFRRIAQMR
jgi:CRP/FNR family transcriptional regulator